LETGIKEEIMSKLGIAEDRVEIEFFERLSVDEGVHCWDMG
jgi:hypothetical protein